MIKIIDYRAGNAPSVLHAITHLGYEASFAHNPLDLKDAGHIILPGVGSAKATMESLAEMDLLDALEEAVLRKKILFLGICVGLQILFEHSEEGDTDCLGWLPGRVVKFDASKVRVPQMGWNRVCFIKSALSKSECLKNARLKNARLKNALSGESEDFFYFVNSYHAKPEEPSDLWGTADYNGPFAAAVCRDNIYATQFHIEKSGRAGLALLESFLKQSVLRRNERG